MRPVSLLLQMLPSLLLPALLRSWWSREYCRPTTCEAAAGSLKSQQTGWEQLYRRVWHCSRELDKLRLWGQLGSWLCV